jgi:asparagine synthase (glutamine-hydrolysing)
MCGICGVLHLNTQPIDKNCLRTMNETLRHRGPDGEGVFVENNIGLAMRRLSIIDVAGSDQPLYNENRSITVVFNGEIYNFRELREDLTAAGHLLRTAGDGETLAHLYEEWGADMPKQLRGMYAFALWDAAERRLLIGRDRVGEKPLYYYHDKNIFVFASEIKALLRHPAVPRQSALHDPQNLALYLGYGYIPAPATPFVGIQMLPPGHTLMVDAASGNLNIKSYWSPPPIEGISEKAHYEDYIDRLRELLAESVRFRLVSDVPLGAFLSGGLDSSLIVAMMQRQNATVRTFSIGFEGDASFDETPYAAQVAQYLETIHTSFTVKADALELLPKLVWHYDMPFADSSAIPTYLVSQLTREHVTVALTGDGGDELFAGYERFYAAALFEKLNRVPRPIWKSAAAVMRALPEGTDYYNPLKRARRFAAAAAQSPTNAYFDLVRLFSADMLQQLIRQSDAAGEHFGKQFNGSVTLPHLLHANMTTYLPDDLLIKADRSSMAASLEARAPFLDHHLIAFAAQIPFNLKLRGSTTKFMLKQAARGLLPDSIIDRKKHGFGVPLGAWLRHDISQVRETLLSPEARGRNLLDLAIVTRLIDDHASGKRDTSRLLWTLLTLEWWHRLFVDVAALEGV